MIRGAIEIAQDTRMVGWIYSSTESLRGKTVLAFSGDRCVGAGDVSVFRKDLLDAQLGDGFCGFDFPIKLTDGETVGSVYVRLQFSDAAILQPTSRIVGLNDQARSGPDFGLIPPASLPWMADRGMLDQGEHDFLRAIHSAGAYERSLRAGKRGSSEATLQRLDHEAVIRDLLGLIMMSNVSLSCETFASLSDIPAPRDGAAPVMALWSQDRVRISLDERSHHDRDRSAPTVLAETPEGGIDFTFGRDRILFVHADCRFAAKGLAPAAGIVVFTATPADEVGEDLRAEAARAA